MTTVPDDDPVLLLDGLVCAACRNGQIIAYPALLGEVGLVQCRSCGDQPLERTEA